MKKLCAVCALVCGLLLTAPFALASGELPYQPYNYDYRENIVFTPAAYAPDQSVSGVTLNIGAFSNPQGMCVDGDGNIYIADTGNHRIVVLSPDMKSVIDIIESFSNNGAADKFQMPTGVTVSSKKVLYVADSANRRIVALGNEKGSYGEVVKIISDPQSEILGDEYVFTPLKVAVDYADRVYCVARGMFQGLMVFDSEGSFTGFFGTIKVNITVMERFWRFFSTKEERQKQLLFIPTEFTGIDVDADGFVYAANIDPTGTQAVRRMNPKGEDIIKKGVNANVGGDLTINGFNAYAGPSNIVDVVVRGHGMYSLLDSRRGRVFTYDHEGNLLYVFGGIGSQAGVFRTPVSIEASEGRILVLDSYRAEVITFKETEYGALINEAVSLRYDGDETQAVEKWRKVLALDENFELANTGIGKAYLASGENELAMTYLKRGMNREYYSVAFKRYRNDVLKANLGTILTGALVIGAGLIIVRVVKKRGKGEEGASYD